MLTKPRTTPMAGHRKATARYCPMCLAWHGTHRSLEEMPCGCLPKPYKRPECPHLQLVPRTASK